MITQQQKEIKENEKALHVVNSFCNQLLRAIAMAILTPSLEKENKLSEPMPSRSKASARLILNNNMDIDTLTAIIHYYA